MGPPEPVAALTLAHAPVAEGATLRFEENRGQLASDAAFVARSRGGVVAISARGAEVTVARPRSNGLADADELKIALVGANAGTEVTAQGRLAGTVSYFVPGEHGGALTAIPTYARVVARDVRRGVDIHYYGDADGRLEYDLVLQPHVDPSSLRLTFTGARALRVDEHGALQLELPHSTIVQRAPIAYSERGDGRVPVACSYEVVGETDVGFRVDAYDETVPLVIDPVLDYSTYFGGEFFDEVTAVDVAADGSAYVAGFTYSLNLPVDDGAFQPTKRGNIDAFVTRFDPSGSTPIHSTYLGGTDADQATAIAVDEDGNAYVTGWTLSSDFPVSGAAQPQHGGVGDLGIGDAFVVKVSSAGDELAYSTFLGGARDDEGRGIAIADDGGAVVAGRTFSGNFPRVDALQAGLGSPGGVLPDAFVARLRPDGAALQHSSAVGGEGTDEANAVALDRDGNAYFVGYTDSENFPTSAAYQADGYADAFVTSVSTNGALRFSSYLGGRGIDEANGVAIDGDGRIIVVGETDSADFPLASPQQDHPGGGPFDCFDLVACRDAFVTVFDPAATRLEFSTYFGGKGSDLATSVAVDPRGDIHVAGSTGSVDLPTRVPVQARNGGGDSLDAFVARFSRAGDLAAATYLGGDDIELAHDVAADATGNAYVVGVTSSPDFPTAAAFQPESFGSDDGYVARIGYGGGLPSAGGPVVPDTGGDTGIVTIGIYGSGFGADASVELRRPGETSISALAVAVRADGGLVVAQLDLSRRARGLWDVVVAASNGTVVFPGAFAIEAGHPPEIRVSVVARPRIRVGRSEAITVLYTNVGNVDAVMLPITVSGFPPDAEIEVLSPTADPPQPVTGETIDWDAVPEIIDDETGRSFTFVAPRLPPETSGLVRIGIRTASEAVFEVVAEAREPYSDGRPQLVDGIANERVVGCWMALASGAASVAGVAVPLTCLQHMLFFAEGAVIDVSAALIEIHEGHFPVFPLTKLVIGGSAVVFECAAHESPIGKALQLGELFASVADVLYTCWPVLRKGYALISALLAIDPNEKVGISSGGPRHAVVGDSRLAYEVFFENKAEASAPAQEVVITDVLDERLDISTLELGPIQLGDAIFVPEATGFPARGTFDLRSTQGVVATVDVTFDKASRTLTWSFKSVDPATGALPDDPLAGLLPPNRVPPEGAGSVSFTILPLPRQPSGTEIHNAASIVFDTNAPIATQLWSNVIDDRPPASAMVGEDEVVHERRFLVQWEGSDEHAGVREFTVYVAEEDAEFVEWLRTGEESAEFEGEIGRSYAFAVLALDHAGNQEHKDLTPEVEVRVTAASGDDGCGCRVSTPNTCQLLLLLLALPRPHRRRPRRRAA